MRADAPASARRAAIVMGLGPGGLGAVRSLARLGVEVHGVYSGSRLEVGRHSNMLRSRWSLRNAKEPRDVVALLRAIRRRVSPHHRMVLIPATDGHAILVSNHRHDLADDFVLRVPPDDIGTAFLDKRATVQVCQQRDLAIPRSCVPEVLRDVEDAAADFRFPVIIKPALQEDADFPGKNMVVAGAPELIAFYRQRPHLVRRSMFQELVPSGDGYILGINTYSGADGRVVAATSHRRLRQWLPDRGASCFAVTETHLSLMESTIRFLDGLGYVGFAGLEYAEDRVTGEHSFLELNARVVLPNQLFADAGVDLTAIGYREMCGERTPTGLTQQDGVYWLDFHRDAASAFFTWRQGRLGIRRWLGDVRQASSHATFAARDPRPFVASLALLAAGMAGRTSARQARSLRALTDLGRAR